MALLRKEIRDSKHSMRLRHPVLLVPCLYYSLSVRICSCSFCLARSCLRARCTLSLAPALFARVCSLTFLRAACIHALACSFADSLATCRVRVRVHSPTQMPRHPQTLMHVMLIYSLSLSFVVLSRAPFSSPLLLTPLAIVSLNKGIHTWIKTTGVNTRCRHFAASMNE